MYLFITARQIKIMVEVLPCPHDETYFFINHFRKKFVRVLTAVKYKKVFVTFRQRQSADTIKVLLGRFRSLVL
jgi:hypothetical protein